MKCVFYFIYLFFVRAGAAFSLHLWLVPSLSLSFFFFPFPMAALPPLGLAAATTNPTATVRVPASLRSERLASCSRSSSRPAEAPRGSSPAVAPAASAGRRSRGNVLASAATPAPAGPSNDTEVLDELQAIYPPPKSLAAKAEVGSLAEYKRLWQKSIDDPAAFWGDLAEREFFWSKKWDDVFTR